MDPNANLAEARKLAAAIVRQSDRELESEDETNSRQDYERLAELFMALDQWLGRGGALPRAWARK